MRLEYFIFIGALCSVTSAQAQVIVDISTMESLSMAIADTINSSLNGSLQLNTSALISSIIPSIEQSNAHLNNASFISNGTSVDSAYTSYLGGISTLAEATLRRGRVFHSEMNLPVYQALQNLATAVQIYGTTLIKHNMIDQDSRIQTFHTGSDIVTAQGAWANNLNYPGKRDEGA